MVTVEWYWCLTHERVESGDERDDVENCLGPYESPEAAREWRLRNEERALKWKVQDEDWFGPADDDEDDARG
jgi:hypothetical protein